MVCEWFQHLRTSSQRSYHFQASGEGRENFSMTCAATTPNGATATNRGEPQQRRDPPSWQELRAFEEEARRNNLYALSSWSFSVVGVLGLLLPGPGGVESCFSCLCLLQSVCSYLSDVHFVGSNRLALVVDITCATVTLFLSMSIWGVSTGSFALKYALGVSCLACSATLFRMQHRLFQPFHIAWHAMPFSLYVEVRPHDEVGAQIMVLVALAAASTLFIFPPGSFASRPAELLETRNGSSRSRRET